ncbi:MAG TPA: tetratricopeptide repeat protein, partial [Chloroflexota bacterium]|nr:tetratricopeptide repeat protein [Chloroflexota bacterium]
MRRVAHVLALVALLGTACQPAPATPPAKAPSTTAPAESASQATLAPAATSTSAPAPAAAAAPIAQQTPTRPTVLPTLPTWTLGTLPEQQRTAVRSGQAALAASDFGRAIALLEPLASQTSGEPQSEVRLLLGQGFVGDRQYDRGLATAEQLLGSTSRPDLLSAAQQLKGQALRGLDRFDEAAAEMRAVADNNPLVGAAIRLELEDMWLDEANRADQAAVDGKLGLDAAQPRLLKIEVAEKLGKAEVTLKDTDAAMDTYRQLLTAAGSKGFLGEQLYNLAEGASALGRTDDAVGALRTSIEQFPRSRKAPDAVLLLEKLGGMRAEDRFFAGLIRYFFWNFPRARADFDAYLDALPDGDHAFEARYYKALSSPARDTTTQLLELADDVPSDDLAPMALLEAGKAQEELGEYTTAESIYDRLVATYPTRDAGMAGAFRRGLARFMRGNTSGALAAWDELLARDPQPAVRAEALFWSGKTLALAGSDADARTKYRAAAAVRPVDYYVVNAQAELDAPPTAANFVASEVAPADEAELAGWFASHGLDLATAAQTASSDPAYVRAVALVQHGLYRQANWEHEIFLTTYADKPDRLYWLATRFGEMGLPNASLRLGAAALGAATAEGQVSILDVPLALGRAASPLAFPDLVTAMARSRNIDPLLLMSLMHQESDFDPHAESVAKAKGLTQIVPQTGSEIASKLGVKDFQQEDLFQPRQNLVF